MARGLDVKRADVANGQALDWHHFLCTNRYDVLSPEAKQWVSGVN